MERYGQDDKWKKGRRDRLIVSTINSVLSKLSLSLLSISRVDQWTSSIVSLASIRFVSRIDALIKRYFKRRAEEKLGTNIIRGEKNGEKIKRFRAFSLS